MEGKVVEKRVFLKHAGWFLRLLGFSAKVGERGECVCTGENKAPCFLRAAFPPFCSESSVAVFWGAFVGLGPQASSRQPRVNKPGGISIFSDVYRPNLLHGVSFAGLRCQCQCVWYAPSLPPHVALPSHMIYPFIFCLLKRSRLSLINDI